MSDTVRRTHYAFDHCSDPAEHARVLGLTAHREIRVAHTRTHPDAITEATRRLHMSHNLWPDEPWRIRIQREHDPLRHRHIWVLYAIAPKGTWL